MSDENQYADTLREDIRLLSEANGTSMEEAFYARVTDTITGSGEIDALEYFHHRGTQQSGIRVDGWGGDPRNSKQLTLLVIDHADDPDAPTLTGTELNDKPAVDTADDGRFLSTREPGKRTNKQHDRDAGNGGHSHTIQGIA